MAGLKALACLVRIWILVCHCLTALVFTRAVIMTKLADGRIVLGFRWGLLIVFFLPSSIGANLWRFLFLVTYFKNWCKKRFV